MCSVVQNHLNLTGRRTYYAFPKKDNGTFAHCDRCYEGNAINITFFPIFFKQPLEHQLSIVIHEHLHVVTTPVFQTYNMFRERMADAAQYEKAQTIADEAVTCHLEGVLFTLLRPLCQSLLTN